MATTMRQMINNVLTTLGEQAIPATTTALTTGSYQNQVALFVNQIRQEVEDDTTWRVLKQIYTFSYPTNSLSVPISDTVASGFNNNTPTNAVPNERSRLMYWQEEKTGREIGMVFDITTFGIPFALTEMPQAALHYYNSVLTQTPVAYSTNFVISQTLNNQLSLDVYPGANSTRTMQVTMYTPQPRIDCTVAGNAAQPWLGTMGLDSPILVPSQPIEFGSIWYALQERGEELGISSMYTEERYRTALDTAISRDIAAEGGITMVVG